jgi:hypothetical protein
LIERKADHKDFKQLMDDKMGRVEAIDRFVDRKEFSDMKMVREALDKIQ